MMSTIKNISVMTDSLRREIVPGLRYARVIEHIWGVPQGISITAIDENEIKLNMQMFKLSIVIAFIQGNPVQPFNPFGENRSQSLARQIRQY
jgi:hypothetical protein